MEQAGEVTDQTRDAKTLREVEDQRRYERVRSESDEERRAFLLAQIAAFKADVQGLLQCLEGIERFPDYDWPAESVTNFVNWCFAVQDGHPMTSWEIAMRMGKRR